MKKYLAMAALAITTMGRAENKTNKVIDLSDDFRYNTENVLNNSMKNLTKTASTIGVSAKFMMRGMETMKSNEVLINDSSRKALAFEVENTPVSDEYSKKMQEKGDPEKREQVNNDNTNFGKIKNIFKEAENILKDGNGEKAKRIKELNLDDYGLFKEVPADKEVISYVDKILTQLTLVGDKLDDFKENDLQYNLSNTYISYEIGNYLADEQVKLQGAQNFVIEGIKALDKSEDLVISDKETNKLTDIVSDGKGLLDGQAYDPDQENVFNKFNGRDLQDAQKDLIKISRDFENSKIELKKDPKNVDLFLEMKKQESRYLAKKVEIEELNVIMDKNNFSRTKEAYKKLLGIQKNIRLKQAELLKEEDKDDFEENYKIINDLRTDVNTLKNEFNNLKKFIERDALVKDLAEITNKSVEQIEDKNEKMEDFLDDYEKSREKAFNFLKDKYLSTKDKEFIGIKIGENPLSEKILSTSLTGEPYNLSKVKDIDEALIVLGKYVKENKAETDYITDDVKEIVRRIPSRQAEFKNIGEAVKVLNRKDRKEISDRIEKYIKSETIKEKIELKKKKLDDKTIQEIRARAEKYYLDQINLYTKYYNAHELWKELNDLLGKSPEVENINNLFLQEQRLREESLTEAFKAEVKDENEKLLIKTDLDYTTTELQIETELNSQVALRVAVSESSVDLIEAAEEVTVSNEIDAKLKEALKLMGKEEKEGTVNTEAKEKKEETVDTKIKEKFENNKRQALKDKKNNLGKIKISQESILKNYNNYKKNIPAAIMINAHKEGVFIDKLAEKEEALANQKLAIVKIQEAYQSAINQFNRMAVKTGGRADHDDRLEKISKFLLEAQKELIEKEKAVKLAKKDLYKNLIQSQELTKKEDEVYSELPKIEKEIEKLDEEIINLEEIINSSK